MDNVKNDSVSFMLNQAEVDYLRENHFRLLDQMCGFGRESIGGVYRFYHQPHSVLESLKHALSVQKSYSVSKCPVKKYSNEHMESIAPEFIVALEISEKMVADGDCGSKSCPSIICRKYGITESSSSYTGICPEPNGYCGIAMRYNSRHQCPCHHFGAERCAEEMQNLILQWREWAGLEDGE